MNNLQVFDFSNSIACLEALGLSNCFKAYSDECAGEDILQVGFNPNSGYVYIALENGVQICSMLGNKVEYVIYDHRVDDELYFDDYNEALLAFN